MEWHRTNYKGIRYRLHPTRRHGKKPDIYYTIRHQEGGKRIEEGLGWASETGITLDKAVKILADLRDAATKGEGPSRLSEKREIKRQLEETEIATQERLTKESITFADYFTNAYLPETAIKKSNQVEKFIYDKWVDPVIGKLKINDITEFHLKKIQKRMQDSEKAVRTIHYAFAIVSQVWNRARKDKIIQRDCPTRDVKLPRIDNQKKRFLSKKQSDALLAYLKSKSQQLYELAYVSLYTGARFSELAGLTWRRVSLDDGSIIFRNTKSGQDRTVFMTDGVKQLFRSMNPGLPDSLIFTENRKEGLLLKKLKLTDVEISSLVWADIDLENGILKVRDLKGSRDIHLTNDNVEALKKHQGKPSEYLFRLSSVSTTFDRAISKLGLNAGVIDPRDKISFHSLRHTHASWLVDSGVNLYVVREILGHADFKMTQRYSHVARESIQQAMTGLEKYVVAKQEQQAEQVVNLAK
jgi:integrase